MIPLKVFMCFSLFSLFLIQPNSVGSSQLHSRVYHVVTITQTTAGRIIELVPPAIAETSPTDPVTRCLNTDLCLTQNTSSCLK